ncbi:MULTISPECIES: chemotaxis protein CheW [Oceanibaculum]|uniref:Chemotaxis protein CheA n=1 Tax=Oceanibaculum indicum P24 TaxID=1207063 RepID=K2J5I6_9PROT|nr:MULTISPECIES: chemotaxis protein CheW [Oceanibaculum]EKE70318.1 two-component hybrid sensor and regulator, chemotaxis family, sensor kinase [Oceanibaculum indicum P24]MCH2395925.1 chemotaxis protein CheW [Oceanibaculum sp.]
MDDLLNEFLTETVENLGTLDVELVRLEQNPNDPELLSNIFRIVHTIKGTCGFLGLPRLEAVAHASENVLGRFRDGELEVTPQAVTLILASLDRIKMIIQVLEETEAEPEGEDSDLIAALDAMAAGETTVTIETAAAAAAPAEEPVMAAEEEAAAMGGNEGEVGTRPGEVSLDELEAVFLATPGPEDMAPSQPEEEEEEEPVAAAVPSKPAAVPAASKPATEVARSADESKESSVANQTIRVSVELLENLMTMVSELVLTRNQLLQIMRRYKDSEFTVPLQRLSQVTSELQDGVMKTRMQPIGNAWAKLPRIVRDLSHELNKKIDLRMLGADTELDRQVLELIKDPLTHMVRNSADHGIESIADRLAAGKPETGVITLNAYHEGGHIIIKINDDGRGLNIEKIKQKVLQNGLASEADLEGMTTQQIQQFIFKAGFSTAAQVTSVSGRGVGMDVVRTNIEKIGGTIELNSQEGKGSTFMIKIPLTLAIVSALVVECRGERFAIPQISVVELVRASNNSEHQIEMLNDVPVLRLRDRLLPLVSLAKMLDMDAVETDGERDSFIVVTQVGTYTFGIIVDRVFDTEEIVVKPVAPILRSISLFSGNTILGDGSVIMILDPNGIAAATGEIGVTLDDKRNETLAIDSSASRARTSLLVFRAGDESPKAVPLALVARLEEIDCSKVEWSDGRPVVQYRGRLMPLVPIFDGYQVKSEGTQPVLVFAEKERAMGLMVDEIVDIIEDRIEINMKTERRGLMGSAIIGGKATEVIDAGHYLSQAFADWFDADATLPEEKKDLTGKRVLLVDDSPFFRNLLTPLLTVAGYEVTAAENASTALSYCEEGRDFDVIVSDIEMPGMSGFDFAKAVRESRWQDVPMVALSSHTSPRDLDRGREAGFNDYVAKDDRDALLQTLSQTIGIM